MTRVTKICTALVRLTVEIDRAQQALYMPGARVEHPEIRADICALLGALHHLVRQYHAIIDPTEF